MTPTEFQLCLKELRAAIRAHKAFLELADVADIAGNSRERDRFDTLAHNWALYISDIERVMKAHTQSQ